MRSAVPTWLGVALLSSRAMACYYSALNLENPVDYYYRYCQLGCKGMDNAQQIYNACCTPYAIGATTPTECVVSATSSSLMVGASGQCTWGSVATEGFPTTSYSDSTSCTKTALSSPFVPSTTTGSGTKGESTTSSKVPTTSSFKPSPSPTTSSPPVTSSKRPQTSSDCDSSSETSKTKPKTSTTKPKTSSVPPKKKPSATPTKTSTKTTAKEADMTVTLHTTLTKCWCPKDGTLTTCSDQNGHHWYTR